jgi:hypothetical protein
MPARGGFFIWTMLAMLAGGITVDGVRAGLTHEASRNVRLNDKPTSRELLLVERNRFFVSFPVEYPEKQWSGAGLAYTDVAHFVGWPPRITP